MDRAAEAERLGILAYHGGDLDAARRRFPKAPEPWIDLSTGINPHAYPFRAPSAEAWARLPTPAALAKLEAAAAQAYGAAGAEVVAAPGTQAVIQRLPQLVSARRVGILGFTYAEHDRAWRAQGCTTDTVDRVVALADFDVAVVVNPNNPDGRLLSGAALADLSGALGRSGGALVVDEAFMDVVRPSASLVGRMPAARTIVLRSLGKSYGLAGLRLGFAIATRDIAPALRSALGPWAVSGPAIDIGCQALADSAWLEGTIASLTHAAERLDAALRRYGFRVIGGTPLYRLAEHPRARACFERLGEAGILVRPFEEQPTWLRFGIPAEETAWMRLEAALTACARFRSGRAR